MAHAGATRDSWGIPAFLPAGRATYPLAGLPLLGEGGAGRTQRRLDGGRCAASSGVERGIVCLGWLEQSGGGGRGEGGFCGGMFQQEGFICPLPCLKQWKFGSTMGAFPTSQLGDAAKVEIGRDFGGQGVRCLPWTRGMVINMPLFDKWVFWRTGDMWVRGLCQWVFAAGQPPKRKSSSSAYNSQPMLQLAEGRRSRSPQHSSFYLKYIEAILHDLCHSGLLFWSSWIRLEELRGAVMDQAALVEPCGLGSRVEHTWWMQTHDGCIFLLK